MTFLEPIIAALIGAATGALAMYLRKNAGVQSILKYGSIAKRAYDIIDPMLDQNLHNWKGSQIDRAFELTIESVSDNQLTKYEIKELAFFMAKEWLPQKAADKVRAFEKFATPPAEIIAASKIAARINKI